MKDDFVPFSTSGNTMSDAAVTEHQGVSSSTLSHFRKKRARYIRDLIDAIHAEKGSCSILDIGGIEDYWNVVGIEYLNSKNVRIELINMEKHPPPRDTSIFSVQRGDGCSLPYHDNSFDLVHSNSVIEHVGDWTHKVAFSTECRRISPRYYVQTPNFWFPWEPHLEAPFVHWLPESIRAWVLLHKKLGTYDRARDVGAAMQILSDASLLSFSMMKFLFPDAKIVRERFCGMTKSFIAIRA